MSRVKIKIQPLFIIYIFICLYFGWVNNIFYYVLTISIHEYAHLYIARRLGYESDSILFSLSGAGLITNKSFKEKHDIIISLAGPLINLIIIIILISCWWIFPTSYLYTYDFVIANLVVMIFNLLPFYPLDGGRVLLSILYLKGCDRNKFEKISLRLSFVLGVIFAILFIVSLFYKVNYNLIIIAIFMTINSIPHDNNRYYAKSLSYNKNYEKPIEIKEFYVNTNDKTKLLKHISPHYYSVFIVKNGNKFYRLEEKDLLEYKD